MELLEDVHLDLIVRFQQFLVLLGHLLSTLVHVLLGSTEFDNVGLLTDVREGDLNTRIAKMNIRNLQTTVFYGRISGCYTVSEIGSSFNSMV